MKPENIGFDVRGDAKLFDFGLSKELHDRDKTKDGLYLMSGLTGSRRYMAPEVVLCLVRIFIVRDQSFHCNVLDSTNF